jgi:hypothetical protein
MGKGASSLPPPCAGEWQMAFREKTSPGMQLPDVANSILGTDKQ